jgi:hypothetical protein
MSVLHLKLTGLTAQHSRRKVVVCQVVSPEDHIYLHRQNLRNLIIQVGVFKRMDTAETRKIT